MKIHDCKDDDKVGAGADETQQTHAAGMGEIHWHGDVDPLESRPQLINKLLPEVGSGLISGQWGTYKTFVATDIATSVMSGVKFIDFAVIRKGGVLFIAAEGASEVPARIEAAIKAKCPDLHPAPFAWIETCPALMDPHTSANLAAKAKVVADKMKAKWKMTLAELTKATGAFVLGVDHFGKAVETGTRGSSAKEDAADVVLALLGDRN